MSAEHTHPAFSEKEKELFFILIILPFRMQKYNYFYESGCKISKKRELIVIIKKNCLYLQRNFRTNDQE